MAGKSVHLNAVRLIPIHNHNCFMYSNLRPQGFYRNDWSHQPSKPPVNEDLLKSGSVQVERKTFVFALKENLRGRLLRITEDAGNRRNTIIIPSTGLKDFQKMLTEMIQAAEEMPAPPAGHDVSTDSLEQ